MIAMLYIRRNHSNFTYWRYFKSGCCAARMVSQLTEITNKLCLFVVVVVVVQLSGLNQLRQIFLGSSLRLFGVHKGCFHDTSIGHCLWCLVPGNELS
jgi:hypothetical protein